MTAFIGVHCHYVCFIIHVFHIPWITCNQGCLANLSDYNLPVYELHSHELFTGTCFDKSKFLKCEAWLILVTYTINLDIIFNQKNDR